MTLIYGIRHPVTKVTHYVGKTEGSLQERLKRHLREHRGYRAGHTKKNRWVAKLLREGLQPEIYLIEDVPTGSDWAAREIFWIGHHREMKGKLMLNFTDGGQGPAGLKHSEETKRKLSVLFKGRSNKAIIGHTVSEETRRKISASLTGRKSIRKNYRHSPETLMKMSIAKKGKRQTAEHRLKAAKARIGLKQSKEAKKNMSLAAKKRVATEAGREQILEAIRIRQAKRLARAMMADA